MVTVLQVHATGYAVVATCASAADLKFLHHRQQARL